MSFAVIRIQKMKSGTVKGIQIHDQREKEHSNTNSDIDFSKSMLNQDLYNTKKINFNAQIKNRIKELNLQRAVRKDAIVMCQCLITSDKEFFDKLSYDDCMAFFRDSLEFVKNKYGEENIISAIVHYDEKTPHMHVNFVPVTKDGRLCAKDLFKRKDLLKLHDDFYKHCNTRGYNLKRGEGKKEFQKHLSVEEFKIKTKKQEIEKENKELIEMHDILKNDYSALRHVTNDIVDIEHVKAKKTILGANMKLSREDYEKLKDMAKGCIYNKNSLKESNTINENLKKINDDLTKQYHEKLDKISDLKKMNYRLNREINKLRDYQSEIYEVLEKNNLLSHVEKEIEKNREAKKLKEQERKERRQEQYQKQYQEKLLARRLINKNKVSNFEMER